jgi:hypothetical protein
MQIISQKRSELHLGVVVFFGGGIILTEYKPAVLIILVRGPEIFYM